MCVQHCVAAQRIATHRHIQMVLAMPEKKRDKLKALDKLEEDTRPLEADRGPTLVVQNILQVQGYQ